MQWKAELESGAIQTTKVSLPADVVQWFKVQMGQDGETGGTAWIALMEQTLRAHVLTCTGTQLHSPRVVFGQQAADTSG